MFFCIRETQYCMYNKPFSIGYTQTLTKTEKNVSAITTELPMSWKTSISDYERANNGHTEDKEATKEATKDGSLLSILVLILIIDVSVLVLLFVLFIIIKAREYFKNIGKKRNLESLHENAETTIASNLNISSNQEMTTQPLNSLYYTD